MKGPPPETAVRGVVAACHGDNEENFRWMASPVDQSKVVSVGAVETNRGAKISAICKLSLAATAKMKERGSAAESREWVEGAAQDPDMCLCMAGVGL